MRLPSGGRACAVPDADIVHDKFHVSQYLGEAVGKVRRAEHKALMAEGDETRWVTRSRLKPVVEVAHLLKRHWENLPTCLRQRITNAVTEGRPSSWCRWPRH